MPLKGVLLQQLVYRDPADRLISDADLLLPPRTFHTAVRALRAAGYHIGTEAQSGLATKGPRASLEVDVHRRVFPPALFDLQVADMFARGQINDRAFDSVVVVPSPLDLYAQLIGNFAKGRHGAEAAPQKRDFQVVASRFGLKPEPIARHLEQHGLARAARYTLSFVHDPSAHAVLDALDRDPLGEVTSRAARRITTRFGSMAIRSLVAPHLINRTLPRGLLSVTAHVAIGLRARLARRRSRR